MIYLALRKMVLGLEKSWGLKDGDKTERAYSLLNGKFSL